MKWFQGLFFVSCIVLFNGRIMQAQTPLYQSPAFSIYKDRVEQGQYQAVALSPTELKSNYQSQETAFKSPRISFKFSINGLDNEMLPGINHEFVCLGDHGKCQTPTITFGVRYVDSSTVPINTYLIPNTQMKLILDMRPVLKAFEEVGYYENVKGEKIFKEDFKGVFVAGSISPMVWNFDNLIHHKDLELKDDDDDGIYELVLQINLKKNEVPATKHWHLTLDISSSPEFKSQNTLEMAIYNMSLEEMLKAIEVDDTLRTGIDWPGVWTRDVSYSIILSMAYMQTQAAKKSLMAKVNHRLRIIQDTGTGGAWPISTDRMIWAVAAWEIYKVTGQRSWLETIYPIIKNSIDDDLKVAWDENTGLMKGESSFLDWREQTYPRWMEPIDIYESKNLATNALYYQSLILASKMAGLMNDFESEKTYAYIAGLLKKGMNDLLWIPSKQYYGQFLYGKTDQILSPRSEALGEALSVLFNVADLTKQKKMIAKVPVVDFGVPCLFPQSGDIPPYHNNAIWPFVQSFWLLAAAQTGHELSVLHSMASIYRASALFLTNKENFVADNGDWAGTQINSSNMLWSLSGNIALVHKVMFGIYFEENYLRFSPFIPKSWSSHRLLHNFKYRESVLNIEIQGYGNIIDAFYLDGKKQQRPIIPSNLTGLHDVKVVMANNKLESNSINLIKNQFAPVTPLTQLNQGVLSWMATGDNSYYKIFKNGEYWKWTDQTFISIPFNEEGVYQVVAQNQEGIESFASAPLELSDLGKKTIYEVEDFVEASTLPYRGYSGEGFVEINHQINRTIDLMIEIDEEGDYLIDWRYSNGNGPINTENKCAIRTLFVNEKRIGAYVFPQRGINEWSQWGISNSFKVHLMKGSQFFKLTFLPENENMNGQTNQAMIDYLRIRKL